MDQAVETGEKINISHPCFFANPIKEANKVVGYAKGERVFLDRNPLSTPLGSGWKAGDIFWEQAPKGDTGPLNVDGKAIFQIVDIQNSDAFVKRLTKEEAEKAMQQQTIPEDAEIVYPWRSQEETIEQKRRKITGRLEKRWRREALEAIDKKT